MQKGTFVKNIKNQDKVKGIFCVSSKKLLLTKQKKPYLALRLLDSTGEIEARVWDNAKKSGEIFEEGDFIRVQAVGTEFMGKIQVTISDISRVDPDTVDPSLFMPASTIPLGDLQKEFMQFKASINRPVIKLVLMTLFDDKGFFSKFSTAPAAKRMHHAWIHGLLEHTVYVARLADAVCRLYPGLERDLLMAGALCHDIGKADELTFEGPPIDYSDRGRLLGHIMLGISRIEDAASKAGIDRDHPDCIALKHLVLSHHGELEFGSPVLPMTPEAVILNMIDNMDAKMNYLGQLKEKLPDEKSSWTDYQNLFNRYFYLTPGSSDQDNHSHEE